MNQFRHNLLEVDMKKELKKLALNQETLRNLGPCRTARRGGRFQHHVRLRERPTDLS